MFFSNLNVEKKIMIISVYLANLFDSKKTTTNQNQFFMFFDILKEIFGLQKIITYLLNRVVHF